VCAHRLRALPHLQSPLIPPPPRSPSLDVSPSRTPFGHALQHMQFRNAYAWYIREVKSTIVNEFTVEMCTSGIGDDDDDDDDQKPLKFF
jgi:hypothetical protein